jgi:DNA-binding transcriptional LysR family regulator
VLGGNCAARVTDLQSNLFIRSRLKTRQIVLLLYLYEQRTVLRAAELAGMTQPAASRMLGEMEGALGVKLFERHARGVEPTWYGEILVRHARSALMEIDRAYEEILALKSGLTGQASIGTVTNPGTHMVPQAIARIKRSHPRLLISVEMDSSRPLVNKLLEGRLDCVIGRILDPQGANELNFEPLFDEPHSVVARADHPLARNADLALADLLDLGWILQGSGGVLRGRFDSMLRAKGLLQPTNLVETSSLPLTIALLQVTDMVSVLPEQSVQPYCEAGLLTILPVALGVTMDFFGIITHRGRPLSPGAEVVLKALRHTAAALSSNTP